MMTKGKKKALIITLSIVGVLVIAIAVTLAVLFTKKPEQPAASEGAIYQTESKIIWSGVAGVAYISFEYVEEPAVPEDGALYGYVFKVMADGSTDVTKCTPWLSGKWELEENNGVYGTLTLTATWDDEDSNSTKLTDATSGEPKTYSLEDGEYKIGISFSAGADLMFTLNPVTDKVGEDQTTKPTPPCTEHVDADGDGKCDNCGADMPEQPEQGQVELTMKSEANAAGQIARLLLYKNKTWEFSICFYGDTYNHMAAGTWAIRADYSAIDLAITEDEANVLGGENIVVVLDASNPTDVKYSVTLNCTVPQVGELTFALEKVDNEQPSEPDPDPDPDPDPAPEPGDALYTSNVASIYSGQDSAYLALEERCPIKQSDDG